MKKLLGPDYEQEAVPSSAYLGALAVARDLKRLREAAHLTLPELAARSGIHATAISRLENGRLPNPTWETLHRLATALGKRLEVRFVEGQG